jgi:maspardin
MTPSALLKKLVMGSKAMQSFSNDQSIIDAVEFMSEKLDTLSQSELASRLTLNCINCYVEPQKLHNLSITIMDVSLDTHLFFMF